MRQITSPVRAAALHRAGMASRTSENESAVCGITAAGAVGAAVALGAAVDAGAEVVPEELPLLEEASLAAGAAVGAGVAVGACVGFGSSRGLGCSLSFQLMPKGDREETVTTSLPSFSAGVSSSTSPLSFIWLTTKSYCAAVSAVIPFGKVKLISRPFFGKSSAVASTQFIPSVLTCSLTS